MKNKIVFLLVVVPIIGYVHDETGGFLTLTDIAWRVRQKKIVT